MAVEFEVQVEWEAGVWQDETPYLRRARIRSGFAQAGDPVAGPGECVLTLDNRTRRFSPGNAAGSLAGLLRPRRRVRVTAADDDGTHTLFAGTIDRITPDAGSWGAGEVEIASSDAIPLLARARIGVPHEDSKPVAEAVEAVIAQVTAPPAASLDDNGDTLAHYGRAWPPESTTALDALRLICETVYGRFFITRGGQVTFHSRERAQTPLAAPVLVVDTSTPLDGLRVSMGIEPVLNQAQVTVYPVETLGALQLIWAARTVLRLAPGETRTIYGLFRDAAGTRVGAVNVPPLVAGTDYQIWTHPDATGYNLTTAPGVSVTAQAEATRVEITLANATTHVLYVTRLQVWGQPIVTYDPITLAAENVDSLDAYELRARALDLPMQPDPVFGLALAQYLVGRFGAAALNAERIEVRDRARIGAASVFAVELMDKVLIDDPQSGMEGAAHWVRAVTYDIERGGFAATLFLERADEQTYCLLDAPDFAVLDASAVLGL
ncbi:MAG TPA: hypothetical protein PKD09_24885 [Aggregatilinea sp.]|uniref:hypothetical protein n=1 Tax=Aggregatilinea sp. TaxID=2806333 RepID=UPI002BFBF552|nr:hypothetical protein [Aggregatilinea sp.]HML24914.1 hypothetical protein [Aggregatilinea sp.]